MPRRVAYHLGVNARNATDQRGTKFLIGIVALGLAGVTLFFSAWPTLRCTLPPERADGVDCHIGARVLNLVSVEDARVTGVRSVVMVASARGNSDTPPRLMFVTEGGREDLGYFSQQFVADWKRLDAFARNPTMPELRLTRPVTLRTIAAHLAACVLLLISALMIVSAVGRQRSISSG